MVIQVNFLMFVNMAKLVNMHKSKLKPHIVPFMDLHIYIYVAIFVYVRYVGPYSYTQKAVHKVRVVAYKNYFIEPFQVVFPAGEDTKPHGSYFSNK